MTSVHNAGEGCHRVVGYVTPCGKDLAVAIIGGTHPHIGAVAVGQPRPSLRASGRLSASTSVLCVIGHKDDAVAKYAADTMAAVCNCTVSVSVGLHVDDATGEDIELLWKNARSVIDEIVAHYHDVAASPIE